VNRARLALTAVCLVAAAAGATAAPAAGKPRLEIAPLPAGGKPAPSTPIVYWDTGDGTPGELTVASNDGRETVFASGPAGSLEAPWLGPGGKHVFRLYTLAGKRSVIATLEVGDAGALPVRLTPPVAEPPTTPAAVDRLLQLTPALALAALAALVVLYVRERRAA
jgi:hypothetical protein